MPHDETIQAALVECEASLSKLIAAAKERRKKARGAGKKEKKMEKEEDATVASTRAVDSKECRDYGCSYIPPTSAVGFQRCSFGANYRFAD